MIGMLEDWNIGMVASEISKGRLIIIPLFHYSIHHSLIPVGHGGR
jgi:hypothetical protein